MKITNSRVRSQLNSQSYEMIIIKISKYFQTLQFLEFSADAGFNAEEIASSENRNRVFPVTSIFQSFAVSSETFFRTII